MAKFLTLLNLNFFWAVFFVSLSTVESIYGKNIFNPTKLVTKGFLTDSATGNDEIYSLEFKTPYDGTNSDVFITLFGSKGEDTVEIQCKNKCNQLNIAYFTVSIKPIGIINRVELTLKNKVSWVITKLKVKNLNTSETASWSGFRKIKGKAEVIDLKPTLQETKRVIWTMPTPKLPTTVETTTKISKPISLKPYSTTCYNGWVDVNDLCYRIINKKMMANDDIAGKCPSNSIVARKIPENITSKLGYNDIVWVNNSKILQACDMENSSICETSANYNILCSRKKINAVVKLSGLNYFNSMNWMIPNSKSALDTIRYLYSKCCSSVGMWIGLYTNQNHLFLPDGTPLSYEEELLLNISDFVPSNRKCAMYNGSIHLTSCNLKKVGLVLHRAASHTTSTKNTITTKTNSVSLRSSSHFPLSSFLSPSSSFSSSSSFFSSSPDFSLPSPKNSPPSDSSSSSSSSYYYTPARSHPTVKRAEESCQCPCSLFSLNISAEEFQESLNDIVIDTKETSKYKRSKSSAEDDRPTSKAMGMVAVVFIAIPFGLLVIVDIPTILFQITTTCSHFTKGKTPKKKIQNITK